jgi:hypothetical protein
LPAGFFEEPLLDAILHVVLGSRDPEHAAHGQVVEMRIVHVSLVEEGDFARLESRAQLPRALVVVVGRRVHDGEGRHEALQVEPKMQLRRCFPSPVARPVNAVDHEADRRGVNGVHGALETARHAPESLAAKPRIRCGEVVQDRPEQRLRHLAIAFPIGVRECVLRGGHRIANSQQLCRMILQRVANIVQTERVRELCVE